MHSDSARGADREIFASLFRIALPVMAGSLVETLYNLTDAFFLGKLGATEISAPSIAFPIVFFLIVFGSGLSGAGTTLIAQSKGRGDPKKMSFYLNQMVLILGVAALLLSLVGLVLSRPLLGLLKTPPEVFEAAASYLTIIFAGMPFMFAYFALQASFTAVGDSFTPLWVHLVAVGVNVILDPLLIFGLGPFPRLEVAGAAIATVLSQGVAAVISIAILARGRHGLRLSPGEMRPRADAVKLFLRIGLPSSVGQGLSALGFAVLQGVVNFFGASAIAAFGVGNRIISLFDIPAHGIASAATSLSGQALGARDEARAHRVVRVALVACLVFLTPPLVASFFFGGGLVRFFVNDAEAIRLGGIMFRVVSPSVLLFGLYLVITGAFQGAGATKIIMVLAVVRLWAIRVPLASLLAFGFGIGPVSIWYAMFVSNAVTALAGFVYYKKGSWQGALAGKGV
ncbi:MAG: MATE family efflux transporter [Spirochaetaceae bacterium]|nr:MATE family efflux transporter [Spirochaetaceae bacterium]